jgi:hypothetical protein
MLRSTRSKKPSKPSSELAIGSTRANTMHHVHALDKVYERLTGIQEGLPEGDPSIAELEEAKRAIHAARSRRE